MFLALSAVAYCAGAYLFAHTRLSDRLAEAESGRAELWAVLVTVAAPVAVPAEYAAALFHRMRHTIDAAREFRDRVPF